MRCSVVPSVAFSVQTATSASTHADAAAQFGESGEPITTEILARPQAGLKPGGIKPAAMFGDAVNGETRPQPAAIPVAKAIGELLRAVVLSRPHQMNGLGCWIGLGDPLERLRQLRRLAVGMRRIVNTHLGGRSWCSE